MLIYAAFGNLGQNATAHDLAIGCLLGWLPVLILCSIVDRNPISSKEIRKQLNKLVDTVCVSLQDEKIKTQYIKLFDNYPRMNAQDRIQSISEFVDTLQDRPDSERQEFFIQFAGQGRVRWHYGAAHPILSDIEKSYVNSRNWLKDEAEARAHLVLGGVEEGLVWFDFSELWQITAAIAVVSGTCLGAFVLSFYTPTVGLGCRSGGYLVFGTISFGLLVCEFLVWRLSSPLHPERLRRFRSLSTVGFAERGMRGMLRPLWSIGITSIWKDKHISNSRFVKQIEGKIERFNGSALQFWWETCFFRPAELINTIWLLYIVLAQTFGAYRNCECRTSIWGGGGGYMDFNNYDSTNSSYIFVYWTTGTTLSTSIMSIGLIYVVIEVSARVY